MDVTNPYSAMLFVVALVSLLLAGYGWRHRSVPGALPFAGVMGGSALWSSAYALRLGTTALDSYRFWMNVEWCALLLIPTMWLLFALDYTGKERWLTKRTLALLSVGPALSIAFAWTNESHGLFRREAAETLSASGPLPVWEIAPGVVYWASIAYINVLLLVGTALVVLLLVSTPRLYRDRNVALVVAVVIPWGASVVDLARIAAAGMVPGLLVTPFALAGSGIALAWALFSTRLFETLPVTPSVAHDVVFDELGDGIVIIDGDDRIVDCNPAARALARADGPGSVHGAYIESVFPAVYPLLYETDRDEAVQRKVVLEENGCERYFEVRVSPIRRRQERLVGRLVTIHDIDERLIREQRLNVLNRVLRHNVRNKMTVVLGRADNLRASVSDPVLVEEVDAMSRAGRRLLDWAERAQDIEQTVGEKGTRTVVDLSECTRQVVADVRERYSYVGVRVTLPERAPVVGSEAIGTAVAELVENAVEHSDRARPSIHLAVEVSDEWVELSVADRGPGIPADDRQALARGHETPLRHASGLGLWSVNWIVRSAGGTIRFEENDPRGSVVRLQFRNAGDRELRP